MNYQNKVAIITGGASGIGKAFAQHLAARGARVHICDIQADSVKTVAAEIGPNVSAHVVDVGNAEDVFHTVQSIYATEGKIDFYYNNAGIGIGGESQEVTDLEWKAIVNINILGVVNGIQAVYPLMIEQGFGHIINTASLAGLAPAALMTPYSMTKHAVVGLSKSLRLEAVKYGVKVSVLCPAAIETPILDNANPLNLDKLRWNPNIRRYLEKLAGKPYPVDLFVEKALRAIENNRNVIMLPRRAQMFYMIGALFPALAEKQMLKALEYERADRD